MAQRRRTYICSCHREDVATWMVAHPLHVPRAEVLPPALMGMFIGKQGANIKTFQEKLECKIDVGRDTGQVTVSLQDEETQDAEVRSGSSRWGTELSELRTVQWPPAHAAVLGSLRFDFSTHDGVDHIIPFSCEVLVFQKFLLLR